MAYFQQLQTHMLQTHAEEVLITMRLPVHDGVSGTLTHRLSSPWNERRIYLHDCLCRLPLEANRASQHLGWPLGRQQCCQSWRLLQWEPAQATQTLVAQKG